MNKALDNLFTKADRAIELLRQAQKELQEIDLMVSAAGVNQQLIMDIDKFLTSLEGE